MPKVKKHRRVTVRKDTEQEKVLEQKTNESNKFVELSANGAVSNKRVYICNFCENKQEDSQSSDPTTFWCQVCGKANPV